MKKNRSVRTAVAVFAAPNPDSPRERLLFGSLASSCLETLKPLDGMDKYVVTERPYVEALNRTIADDPSFTVTTAGPRGSLNLRVRVEATVRSLFQRGYDNVIALAADTPGLSTEQLRETRRRLRSPSPTAVLGPSYDGGFYLLGLNAYRGRLFEDVPFFTSRTFSALRARLQKLGYRMRRLDSLGDVDGLFDALRVLRDTTTERLQWLLRLVLRWVRGRQLAPGIPIVSVRACHLVHRCRAPPPQDFV